MYREGTMLERGVLFSFHGGIKTGSFCKDSGIQPLASLVRVPEPYEATSTDGGKRDLIMYSLIFNGAHKHHFSMPPLCRFEVIFGIVG